MMPRLRRVTDDSGGRQPKNPLGPTGDRVLANVKRLRQSQGLTYKELSDRLDRLDRPIPVLGLSRLEKGERRVDVDDLVALSLALGVTPNRLMLPDAGMVSASADVMVTPNMEASAIRAWEWAQGERPPPMPSGESQSWFAEDDDPARTGVSFAIENRPHLTSIPAREAVLGAAAPPAPGKRELMLAVLTFVAEGLKNGHQLPEVAAYIRRLTEVLISFPAVMPLDGMREFVEQRTRADRDGGD
jgi:transcriptional regulator with XRE-family HTH domain